MQRLLYSSVNLRKSRVTALLSSRHHKMAFATIANDIKLDILSKTHVEDNVAKRKEISRTFICRSRFSRQPFFLNVESMQRTR